MTRGEQGSATVLNLAIIAAVLLFLGALLGVLSRAAAVSQAAAVADIAALAVAEQGNCAAAEAVLAHNPRFSLTLQRCVLDGPYAQVEVGRGFPFTVRATSRAGPHW